MVKQILAWVWLAVAAVRGAFAIKKIIEGEGEIADKISLVSAELAKVTEKLQALSKETPATWDDTFADALKQILDELAKGMIEELGA